MRNVSAGVRCGGMGARVRIFRLRIYIYERMYIFSDLIKVPM